MRSTCVAQRFDPHHAVGVIDLGSDDLIGERLPETWPTRPRFEFVLAREKGGAAHHAVVSPCVLFVPGFSREGLFGS